MKLYTRTGDDGTTGLYGAQRVAKDDPRIAAVGDVDELNCALGVAIAACRHDSMVAVLQQVQHTLFDLGADLATPLRGAVGQGDPVRRIDAADAAALEAAIDAASASAPPLRQFILPGGTELASRLHLARAVCRRAERACVTLQRLHSINAQVVVLLNRLSDLLFALAREANALEGAADIPWQPRPATDSVS